VVSFRPCRRFSSMILFTAGHVPVVFRRKQPRTIEINGSIAPWVNTVHLMGLRIYTKVYGARPMAEQREAATTGEGSEARARSTTALRSFGRTRRHLARMRGLSRND
jgi:hypothetical protein